LYTSSIGDQIKEDGIDGTYNMHGRDDKCIQNYGWEETTWKTQVYFLHNMHKISALWDGCGLNHSNTTLTLHENHTKSINFVLKWLIAQKNLAYNIKYTSRQGLQC
jgi:hypothetical protein